MTQTLEDATVITMGEVPKPGASLQPIALSDLPDEPLVSVLVSNYNYGRFVGDALKSVLEQTYGRIEIIVCDDGSTDDSSSVIEAIGAEDDRVSLIRKPNGGQGSAFNAAFAASKGQVVCFLDADDLFSPEKVQTCLNSLRRTNAGLLVHQMIIVDADGRRLQTIPTFTRFEHGWIRDQVLTRGGRWRWAPTSGVVLRREVADAVFPMPEEPFRTDADTFFLMFAPLITSIEGIGETLALYRLHGSNAFGQKGFDRHAVIRTTAALATGIEEVNKRLAILGASDVYLDPARNLKLLEHSFLAAALEGLESRGQLASRYGELVRALRKDDLYDRLQKVAGCLLFGVCLMLPPRLRGPWMAATMGASRFKELIRRSRHVLFPRKP
jgi:hypothetical protein